VRNALGHLSEAGGFSAGFGKLSGQRKFPVTFWTLMQSNEGNTMAVLFLFLFLAGSPVNPELQKARDAQNRAEVGTDRHAAFIRGGPASPPTPGRNTRRRSPNRPWRKSPRETHDKGQARTASEAGMKAAERAGRTQARRGPSITVSGAHYADRKLRPLGALGALKYGPLRAG